MDALKVLCVDDEPHVLEGLTLHLWRQCAVVPALSGEAGLAALREQGPFAVVLSDMRMPGMDGATFLARVREAAPDTIRMLLTGQANVGAAIAAVNQGQIFRFLTKPCPPDELQLAFSAALEQYRLVTAEKELLEQTLVGSINALAAVLSLTSPLVFGRATRIQALAKELAGYLSADNTWAIEAAAMLAQLGYVALPEMVVRKQLQRQSLQPEELSMVARAPAVTDAVLAKIPRLGPVREILSLATNRAIPDDVERDDGSLLAAEILRVASEYDDLDSRGKGGRAALPVLRRRAGLYRDAVLEALAALRCSDDEGPEVLEVMVQALSEGMVLVDDIRTAAGRLVLSRGHTVTAALLERLRNFRLGYLRQPLRVVAGGNALGTDRVG